MGKPGEARPAERRNRGSFATVAHQVGTSNTAGLHPSAATESAFRARRGHPLSGRLHRAPDTRRKKRLSHTAPARNLDCEMCLALDPRPVEVSNTRRGRVNRGSSFGLSHRRGSGWVPSGAGLFRSGLGAGAHAASETVT